MLEEPVAKQSKLIPNLLVLITVIGFALSGWLVGHILRHTLPAYQFQHPPIQEVDPNIKNGFESEGIRREAVLMGNPAVQVFLGEGSLSLGETLFQAYVGNTYYTSLPAKCRSVDGRLVIVGNSPGQRVLTPPDK